MLTQQEEQYMKEIYADVVDDIPDDEMLELMQELDCMDKDEQFDYIMKIGKVDNPREDKKECFCCCGCNYCLMTSW